MLDTQQLQSRERLKTTQSRAKELAQQAAQQGADSAKEEFGRVAFETLEEYFPEQAKARRRRNRLRPLATGIVIGFLLRHFVSRRS